MYVHKTFPKDSAPDIVQNGQLFIKLHENEALLTKINNPLSRALLRKGDEELNTLKKKALEQSRDLLMYMVYNSEPHGYEYLRHTSSSSIKNAYGADVSLGKKALKRATYKIAADETVRDSVSKGITLMLLNKIIYGIGERLKPKGQNITIAC
jgi:hypothetical protein